MSTGYSAYTAKKTPFIPQKYFPRRPPRGYIRQDSRCGPARHSAPARADRRRDRHRARQLVGRHIKPEVSEHRLQHKSAFDQLLIVARELLGGLKIAVCQAGVSLLAAEYVHLCARFIYGLHEKHAHQQHGHRRNDGAEYNHPAPPQKLAKQLAGFKFNGVAYDCAAPYPLPLRFTARFPGILKPPAPFSTVFSHRVQGSTR